jgi:drug/metabolite transporter (DMT)-like permease
VSSTDAAIIYTMEPVLGAGMAYVMLGERWGKLGWLGAALIIASSLAAQIVGTEDEPKTEKQRNALPAASEKER